MRAFVVCLVAIVGSAVCVVRPAEAQDSWLHAQFDISGGVGLPMGEWAEDDAIGLGSGASLLLRLRASRSVSVYAAASWWRFRTDEGAPSGISDASYTDVGGSGGIELALPVALGARPFVAAGLALDRLSVDGTVGSVPIDASSDLSPGFELRAGVRLPVAASLAVTPLVRFRSFDPRWYDDSELGRKVSYLALEMGLSLGGGER
jgi:hypothetical protein